jgi:elongation factor 1-alpha
MAGHLLFKSGVIDDEKIEAFENKLKNDTDELQKRSSKYAWLFDQLAAERKIGATIKTSFHSFESSRFKFNIIDTPGRRDFTEDLITGMSQADVGLLVVDSSEIGDNVSIDYNEQTKELCLLAYTLGVKQMIVAINKMDDETVNYSENRWKMIRGELVSCLKRVGYKPMKIPFVPISGLQGDNLDSRSIFMSWYGGSTLLGALNNVTVPKRPIEKPLRVPIQEVRNTEGTGVILIGRVETGILKPGMSVKLTPPGSLGVVESLQINCNTMPQAIPGDIVCIGVEGRWSGATSVRPGHVLSNFEDCPARELSRFEAQVIIKSQAGKFSIGYTPIVDCHASHTPCTFINIKEKLDRRTGKILEQNPSNVQIGDVCIVEMEPQRPLCVEQFKDFPPLGRFAIRDSEQIVAVGVVKTTFYGDSNKG